MSKQHFVCQGAICQCKFGTIPDTLQIKTQSKHYINEKEEKEKRLATNQEVGAVFRHNSFGSCAQMNNKPCQVMVTDWSGIYDKIKVEENKGYPLLENSKATCLIGGPDCIVIDFHGQTVEITVQNQAQSNQEVLMELSPFVDLDLEHEPKKLYNASE